MIISKEKFAKRLTQKREQGYEAGLEEAERKLTLKDNKITKLERELSKANTELEVLREDKEEARDVLKAKIEAEDLTSILAKTKQLQDKREEALNKRAEEIDSEEEANYVKGYADGIADGLRKVHEMTEKDRDNLAKVAMVAAASHTDIATMKEINSEFRLTAGSTDKKGK